MSKLTTEPWNAGSATPTTVRGYALRWMVLPTMSGIGAEGAAPQAVAEHDVGVLSWRDFVRREKHAAELRAHAEQLKVVAGDELAPHALAAVAEAQAEGRERRSREARECAVVVADDTCSPDTTA